jgi:hypothetical protein
MEYYSTSFTHVFGEKPLLQNGSGLGCQFWQFTTNDAGGMRETWLLTGAR